METKTLHCRICQNQCEITVEVEEDEVISVDGNGCLKGFIFAEREALNPE